MTRPVVVLLTDFGVTDPFVGVMKGVILGRCPEAAIVDLSHAVPPQATMEGAFWLERSYRWFPEGAVFVAVVDPGVGTGRHAVVAYAHRRLFVGPDNGLLAPAVAGDPRGEVYAIDAARLRLRVPSRTFHGRDVFAPVAAELASGRLAPSDVGPSLPALRPGAIPTPATHEGAIEGLVISIDRFGNLITNVQAASIAGMGEVTVEVGRHRVPLRGTYAEAGPGECLALVNAFDTIEIAQRDGDAARTLGIERGATVFVRS